MKQPFLAMCVALAGFGLGPLPTAHAAKESADETAVRKAAQMFVDSFDRADAAAVATHWTPDGEYVIGDNSVKGREAIARLYEQFFRAHPGSKMQVKIDSIRVLAPTVAIEQGTASVENQPGGQSSASAYTAVHVKENGKWLMASVRESEMPTVTGGGDLGELDWLVGSWTVSGDAAKVTMTYEWMANMHFLRGETRVAGKDGESSGGVEVIGRDPISGQIVSWYFDAGGGNGFGEWSNEGSRWLINTQGTSADGAPTSAINILYRANDNVTSRQSVERIIGDTKLPDAKEVVIERVSGRKPIN